MPDRIDILLQYHREDPADPFTLFALAREYEKRGADEEALRYYERLVHEQPDYVGTYYHLGKLYEQLGRSGDAIRVYQAGIVVAGQKTDFHARAELQSALLAAQGIGFDEA